MATWIVTGSNRGIGLEMCRQLAARGEDVLGACRRPSRELEAIGCEVVPGVDVTSESSGSALERTLGDRTIDVLVHNAGVLLDGFFVHEDRVYDVDHLSTLDFDVIRRELEVNTLGPLRLTARLLKRLHAGSRIGFISSRAGSIGGHRSGGLYGYRMSKAALNMAGATLARDLAGRGISVVMLHPGFIRTEMTGGAGHDEPSVAARGLIARLDELTAKTSGRFFHANGEELPW